MSLQGEYVGPCSFGSGVERRREWRADGRTVRMESKGPEQLLALKTGLLSLMVV